MSSDDYHMDWESFREHGKAMIDWIADYHQSVEQYPVRSRSAPGAVRARLPDRMPQKGENFEAIAQDIDEIVMPGITHWQSPGFYAYFPSNVSGPSILGELLSAGLGVQGMLWSTSPACTEVESHVLDWLVDALALPAEFKTTASGGGVIQDSASTATLCALLAARSHAGAPLAKLRVYGSEQTHSSLQKGMRVAGFSDEAFVPLPTDHEGAAKPGALADALAADTARGLVPAMVCATSGTTSSTAFDPIPAMGEICSRASVWLHVDAAMAGSARLCPEFRPMQDGLEYADSYCFNPHKWLFTNFDCDCFFVRDRTHLLAAMAIDPEYLKNPASDAGEVIDYRDWHIPLGRRFRALKLWFVLRHYGVEGLQHHIREHVRLARWFADQVATHPDFELAAPVTLNLVCFRHRLGDAFGERLLESVNASGRLFLTHTKLAGRYTLRLCVGQAKTERRHVEAAWREIESQAAALKGTS